MILMALPLLHPVVAVSTVQLVHSLVKTSLMASSSGLKGT